MAIPSRSCKDKCWREHTNSFSPSNICFSYWFGSSIETISPWESKLAMFQCKKVKKLRTKEKLTALFKNTRPNFEVQKQQTLKHRNTQNGSKSTNHKSQTMNFFFLTGAFRFWLTSQKNPKIQRRFWHRRSRVIRNSCKQVTLNRPPAFLTIGHYIKQCGKILWWK